MHPQRSVTRKLKKVPQSRVPLRWRDVVGNSEYHGRLTPWGLSITYITIGWPFLTSSSPCHKLSHISVSAPLKYVTLFNFQKNCYSQTLQYHLDSCYSCTILFF